MDKRIDLCYDNVKSWGAGRTACAVLWRWDRLHAPLSPERNETVYSIRLIILLVVAQALALLNVPGMTGGTALDPISAADIYQTEDSVILPMDALRVT